MSETTVMQRREFLTAAGKVVLLFPAAMAVAGCGTTDSDSAGQTFTVTSGLMNGHTHAMAVFFDDLSSPPAQGVTYQTTSTPGHSHIVVLTKEQLTSIDQGAALTVLSSITQGHQHPFTIQKP